MSLSQSEDTTITRNRDIPRGFEAGKTIAIEQIGQPGNLYQLLKRVRVGKPIDTAKVNSEQETLGAQKVFEVQSISRYDQAKILLTTPDGTQYVMTPLQKD